MPKIIKCADGRTVEVDESRFQGFNVLSNDAARIVGDLQGRDAGEAMAFLVGQLTYTEAKVYEKKYVPMQYEQLVPISTEAGEWAEAVRYEVEDFAGQGKRSTGRGTDINLVDVAFADVTMPIVSGDIGYDYTVDELRKAAYLRRGLPERKAQAAMEGYRRTMNQVALFGEVASGFTGLFNNANVPVGNAPVGAWITGPKTPAQILGDINTLIENVWSNTAYSDHVTDIVMAPTVYAYIARTPYSANSDKTILSYVKENNIAKTDRGVDINFTPGYGLDTAGVGSTKRMIGYVKSVDRLVFHIPMPLRFLPPQMLGLSVQVPGEYKYSGVEWRYPRSAFYMDGL